MKWSEFIWSVNDCIFLLEHLTMMQEGVSPFTPEPLLVKPKGRRKPLAPFVPACELAADLELRLILTDGDGTLLKWHYSQGISIAEIAKGTGSDFYWVTKRMSRALRYISGRKRKRRSYDDFCNGRGRNYERQNKEASYHS